MHYCCQRLQTDRNTPSRFKMDFLLLKYNGFLSYNGYITFLILPVFDIFEDKIGGVRINNRAPVRGASKRGHENEFCNKFLCFWRPYFRCSSSGTEKTCIYTMLAQHVASEKDVAEDVTDPDLTRATETKIQTPTVTPNQKGKGKAEAKKANRDPDLVPLSGDRKPQDPCSSLLRR